MEIPNVTININKKAKYKTAKQMFEIALKQKHDFNYDGNGIEIYHDEGEFYCNKKDLNKEILIESAVIEYYPNGSVDVITYITKNDEIYDCETDYFSKFPTLTKKQLQVQKPVLPLILKRGLGAPNNDMLFNEKSGILTVGCHTLNKTQVQNTFKFLAKCLEYDLEE